MEDGRVRYVAPKINLRSNKFEVNNLDITSYFASLRYLMEEYHVSMYLALKEAPMIL